MYSWECMELESINLLEAFPLILKLALSYKRLKTPGLNGDTSDIAALISSKSAF